jgi:hypothetical protein
MRGSIFVAKSEERSERESFVRGGGGGGGGSGGTSILEAGVIGGQQGKTCLGLFFGH